MRYALVKNRVVFNVVHSETGVFDLGDAEHAARSDTLNVGDACATPYVLAEILALEARQPRAIREAILTGDNSRVWKLDDEIAALRAQL